MQPRELIDLMDNLERLKCRVRHGWTSSGRRESVAEHSWRLATMALLLKEEFPTLAIDRAVRLSLVHDWGEAVTGDIPTFYKTAADEQTEERAIDGLVAELPCELREEIGALFHEFEEQTTPEARFVKALDKLEAVIQHNEADIATWIPLEYDLNLHYGEKETEPFPFLRGVRALVREDSESKIQQEKARPVAADALCHRGTIPLETPRLILRPLTPADAPAMFRNWAGDPVVTRFLTWPAYTQQEKVAEYLAGMQKNYDEKNFYEWGIESREQGEVVGTIGVVSQNPAAQSAHIGYCLGRAFWGQGIMTEALGRVMAFLFDEVGMQRIDSRHDPRNPASGRVMERCGMVKEGLLRKADRNNQGLCDAVWYGILRDEWRALQEKRG